MEIMYCFSHPWTKPHASPHPVKSQGRAGKESSRKGPGGFRGASGSRVMHTISGHKQGRGQRMKEARSCLSGWEDRMKR